MTLPEPSLKQFKLRKQIGTGSYGQIYVAETRRAEDHSGFLDKPRLTILKKVNLSLLNDEEKDAAMHETHVLQLLAHPNVIKYYCSWSEDGNLWIEMEYATKGDLHMYISQAKERGEHIPEERIFKWFVQLCLALKHCHDKHILHRDLKTQNVFICDNDTLKLGDFGISKILSSSTMFAKTQIGTPFSMSPEVCEDKPYNQKSDIWSLGCVLYEMSTLNHAFGANNLCALILRILRGKYPPIPSHYSKHLENLIASMLQQKPGDRPSIGEILASDFIQNVSNEMMCKVDVYRNAKQTNGEKTQKKASKAKSGGGRRSRQTKRWSQPTKRVSMSVRKSTSSTSSGVSTTKSKSKRKKPSLDSLRKRRRASAEKSDSSPDRESESGTEWFDQVQQQMKQMERHLNPLDNTMINTVQREDIMQERDQQKQQKQEERKKYIVEQIKHKSDSQSDRSSGNSTPSSAAAEEKPLQRAGGFQGVNVKSSQQRKREFLREKKRQKKQKQQEEQAKIKEHKRRMRQIKKGNAGKRVIQKKQNSKPSRKPSQEKASVPAISVENATQERPNLCRSTSTSDRRNSVSDDTKSQDDFSTSSEQSTPSSASNLDERKKKRLSDRAGLKQFLRKQKKNNAKKKNVVANDPLVEVLAPGANSAAIDDSSSESSKPSPKTASNQQHAQVAKPAEPASQPKESSPLVAKPQPKEESGNSKQLRIMHLRQECEHFFGNKVFHSLYNLLRENSDTLDLDSLESEYLQKINALVPPEKMPYLVLVNQLIFCEESANSA